jgi:hypothetical protein
MPFAPPRPARDHRLDVVPHESPGGVVLGEIHTGLLRSSTAVTPDVARDLLALVPNAQVRAWERPIRHAASSQRLTGVDAQLPSRVGARQRAVGTVCTEARITAGHLVQASSRTRIVSAKERRRRPWSHYLSHPGVVEAWSDLRPDDLVESFLRTDPSEETLDLGGITSQFLAEVQRSRDLDGRPPLRAARTCVRWAARSSDSSPGRISFVVEGTTLRTVEISELGSAQRWAELCEDVAMHDWLLSTVTALVDVAHIGGRERHDVLSHLRPVVDHLLHAWMPAARLDDDLRAFWDEIDRRSGLGRQWQALVQRIRDQLGVTAAELVTTGPA